MRDLIVQGLTTLTAPFWKSSLSMDQFVTALEQTFQMVFFAMLFGTIWGFIQAITLLVTRPEGILPNIRTDVNCERYNRSPCTNRRACDKLGQWIDCNH